MSYQQPAFGPGTTAAEDDLFSSADWLSEPNLVLCDVPTRDIEYPLYSADEASLTPTIPMRQAPCVTEALPDTLEIFVE